MRRRTLMHGLGLTALSYATMGASCDQALKWVGKAGDIATMVSKWIKLIEGGLDTFEGALDEDTREKIAAGVAATKKALEVVQEIGKAADNYSRGEQQEAEDNLLAAYRGLFKLIEAVPGFLDDNGALSDPPEGVDNPTPGTPEELELAMSA